MKPPIPAPVSASLDLSRGASIALLWREPPKAFEFEAGPGADRRYRGIHLEAGVRCAQVGWHPPPVAVVDLPDRKMMLLTEINPLEGNDWPSIAESLLHATKDAPSIACQGITFPAIDWEGSDLKGEEEPFVSRAVQHARFPPGYRRARVAVPTAADVSLERATSPLKPVDFRGLLMIAFFVRHKGEDILLTCQMVDWTHWVRA